MRALLTIAAILAWAPAASASGCFAVAQTGGGLIPAAFAAADSVRLTFLGHASFLIESPGGVTAVTDYSDATQPAVLPDIVTMNNAHGTHYTSNPPPGIEHVLRGWGAANGEARHDVTMSDLRVRNLPTAVHGRAGAETNSNSIFVFELPDLCIAHLGHLHQVLTEQQLAELGQIDVLMVPIDGAYTMSQMEMVEVIEQIRPAVVIPMHYFGSTVLDRFLTLVEDRWEIVVSEAPDVALAAETLPRRRVLVLPGY